MAQDSKWSIHDNIWHFTVTDPQLHKNGFTVYKVNCKVLYCMVLENYLSEIRWLWACVCAVLSEIRFPLGFYANTTLSNLT